MVSILNAGKSLRRALSYNENKLKEGQATLLDAVGFAKDMQLLTFNDKLGHLQKMASRNERTSVNSIHISLNFDPSEKLSTEKLVSIASTYLQKIGFENQPYLVYQHHDAGHPHIHIVTTNIKADGKRIKLHNIGRNESSKARKEIERIYGLVRADSRQRETVKQIKPVAVERVQYGRTDTKRAITNVLDYVLSAYKFSTLGELNAVLESYNVMADQGKKDSRIAMTGGLVYRVIDEKGKRVGVPIKASDIYSKPTLKNLQQRFEKNEPLKKTSRTRVKNAIEIALQRSPGQSITNLKETLERQNIQLVIRQNADGVIYGLTYVDHQSKTAHNGSSLGKGYSSNQLQDRLQRPNTTPSQKIAVGQQPRPSVTTDPMAPATEPDGKSILEVYEELSDTGSARGPAAELREEWKRRKKRKPRL